MAPLPCWPKRAQHFEERKQLASAGREDGRDLKVARAGAECTGMIAAIMAVTPMVDARSESTRADRPPQRHDASRAVDQVFL